MGQSKEPSQKPGARSTAGDPPIESADHDSDMGTRYRQTILWFRAQSEGVQIAIGVMLGTAALILPILVIAFWAEIVWAFTLAAYGTLILASLFVIGVGIMGLARWLKTRMRQDQVPEKWASPILPASDEGEFASSGPLWRTMPATERQMTYATDLGISFPPNISRGELSDLIDLHVSHDKPATERHRQLAVSFGLDPPPYIGKRALFDAIAVHLSEPERAEDLAAWFVYRLCRELVHGQQDHPAATGPHALAVREIARVLAGDTRVMKSIRRYQGRDLIWFGEWTSSDGAWHQGGSNQTLAYRRAMPLVRQRFGIGGSLGIAASNAKTRPVHRHRVRNGIAGLIIIAGAFGAVMCSRS